MRTYYFEGGGDTGSGDTGNATDSGATAAGPAIGSDSSSPGGGLSGYETTSTLGQRIQANATPVYTTYGIGAPGTSQYTQQQINDALRAELTARPGTTYADMMRFAGQTYGLAPAQVQTAYDSIQGSVTPYNAPPPEGGIYSAIPAVYQPVRYTPSYDQFGQGIASLFGRGYSQYFQPPGLTGTYFFGDQRGAGGAPTYVPPGGPGGTMPPGATMAPGGGYTAEQIAQFYRNTVGAGSMTEAQFVALLQTMGISNTLLNDARTILLNPTATLVPTTTIRPTVTPTTTIRPTVTPTITPTPTVTTTVSPYLSDIRNIYNAPGSVQNDAAAMSDFMRTNNLSVADMARITGISEQQINSYLGQAGLSDTRLTQYQNLDYGQQQAFLAASDANRELYSQLAGAYNAPGAAAQDAAQVLTVMQQNNLSAADVSRITGIPVNAVNDYLAQAGASTPQQPEGYNQSVYNYVAANINDPVAVYNRMNEVGTNTAGLATALGIPESQVIQYFTDAGLMREST